MNQQENEELQSFKDLGKNQQKILLFMGKVKEGEGVTRQELVKFMVPSFKTENSAQNSVTSSLQRLNQRNLVKSTNTNVRRLSSVKLTKRGREVMEYLKNLQLGEAEHIGGKFISNNEDTEKMDLEDNRLVKKLELENNELRAKIKAIETKSRVLEDSQDSFKKLEKEKVNLEYQIQALEKRNEVLKSEIHTKDLEKPLQEAKFRIEVLEKENESLKSDFNRLKSQIIDLREKDPNISQGVADLGEEIGELKRELMELENSRTHLEDLIFYLQNELGPGLTGSQIEALKGHLSGYPENLFMT